MMTDLINRNYLPDKEQLKRTCKVFSRTSIVIGIITTKICETIKRRNNNKVKCVWAAFEPHNENHIVFVIVTKKSNTDLDFKPEYDVKYRKDGDFSSESKEVILQESDRGLFPEEHEIINIQECINKYTSKLMEKHSNLTIISASLLKCKGYGTQKCIKESKACIVLHVHIKGLIPLRESVFPTHLDGFEVDVREGCFQLDSGKGPHHKHQNVKMGCGIKAKERDDCGTLGGFLEHPKYGLCALTCAHLFIDETPPGNVKKTFDQEGIECMQPYHEYGNTEGNRFGMLKLIFTGERRSVREYPVSLDYALIAVDQNRKPLDGSFPYAKPEEWSDAGFKKYPPTFETGKVIDFHELIQKRSRHNVVKYGSTSILTCGKIPWNAGQYRSIGNEKVWKNQIQINATKNVADEVFSKSGDSGALVFHADDEDNLTAVGLLVGGNGDLGFSLATPICDILADINIQNLKRFNVQDDSNNGIIYPSNSTVTTPENSSFDHCCRKLFAPIISLWRRLFPEQERKPKLKRD
ncbi:uncharacterized protein LOC128558155 [Mercenaria mercenaria]|uniref:uncharacterized protein LOC128558155 n=1 Tax=Mercenaria mercenaria TaxID=6596 RepID=UPI00234E5B34|nr:uncharacterized protein LOC128558155 [Mercenaria mercenaria]